MKVSLLTLLLLLFLSPLWGQTQRGSHLAGGQFQLDNLFRESNNLLTIGLSPNYGYFLFDNLAVGMRGNLEYIRTGNTGLIILSALPTVRFYLPADGRLRVAFLGSAGGGAFGLEGEYTGIFQWDAGPALDFFVNPHLALEAFLFYEGTRQRGAEYTSSIGLRIGLQAFIFNSGK